MRAVPAGAGVVPDEETWRLLDAARRAVDVGMDDKRLRAFVRESNAIEGITRRPKDQEVAAHRKFLKLERPTVAGLVELVAVLQPDAELRDRPEVPGVRVGDHVAPRSGPIIRSALEGVLERAALAVSPYTVHVEYETLHPFTDGNGRSGRALWLWQMVEQRGHRGGIGFLHAWYYASLERAQGRI